MALTGAEEVSRLVETYSPMLLRLACPPPRWAPAWRGRERLRQSLKEEIE